MPLTPRMRTAWEETTGTFARSRWTMEVLPTKPTKGANEMEEAKFTMPRLPQVPNSHAVLEKIAKQQAMQIELAMKQTALLQEIAQALQRRDQPQ